MKIKCNNYFCYKGSVSDCVDALGEVISKDCKICNGTGFIEADEKDYFHPDVNKIIEVFNNQPGFTNWYKYLNEETKSTIKLQITNILDLAAGNYDSEL